MLQLISVDSWHFTQPELSLRWSDLHEIKSALTPVVLGNDHGQMLIKSALHSLVNVCQLFRCMGSLHNNVKNN